MKALTNPENFFHAVYDGGAPVLQTENLRIEVSKKKEQRNSLKTLIVHYYAIENGRRIKFSTLETNNPADVVNDARYELGCFFISAE